MVFRVTLDDGLRERIQSISTTGGGPETEIRNISSTSSFVHRNTVLISVGMVRKEQF